MHFKNTLSKLVLCTTLVPLFSESLIANSVNLNPISSTVSQINTRAKEDQIDYTQFITSDKLLLPRNLYILKGSALAGERLNVFYKNALLSLSQNSNVSAFSSYGQCLTGRWLYQTLANESLMPTESFELKVVARTDHGLISQSTSFELVDENNTTPVRLLPIGDSLTRAGVYLSQVMNSIPNVTTLGTRFYPEDSMPVREGRGGWTLERYMTLINSNELDSPFVFPKIVDGENYKGNTRDWKAICYEKTKHSTYNGFQKIARGWKDDGEFLYDKNGYYKYPSIGDVMVDPSLPIGTQWVEWNGTSWQTMSLQPTEFEFNFSKYMVRYKEAFSTGTPTHVSILLGANEFGMNKEIDNVDLFIERLNQVIDSIHDYDSTIKIILCTPTLAPNSNFVTSSWKNFYTEYDLRMKYVTSKLLEAFDTDEALAKQIYIAPMTLTLDTTNGYTYIEKDEISNGVKKRVIDANNSIHPNNEYGQLQMGSTLAAVIQKYR